jgi:hypothetical protein
MPPQGRSNALATAMMLVSAPLCPPLMSFSFFTSEL